MDLVFVKDNDLSSEVCKEIITKYENDHRKVPGQTAGGLRPEIKNSIDLVISRYEDWENICDFLYKKLDENLKQYINFIKEKFPQDMIIDEQGFNLKPCGFQIQKSGYYRWHNDEMTEYNRVRTITFIWYLNTIEEGGETGFHFKKVKPEEGKFVFFPATWDYPHCGFPAENKYIITGWLWRNI